jgi:transposase
MCEEPHRLIFLDETGTTTNMTRLRGRAPYGERLKMAAPFGHWHTQTFVAGLRCDGLVAPWVLDGPMNGEAFETYIETQLAPILVRGDVVIMDNLSSHKTERVEQLIRERGAWPLFLPPYSPDLNPIEMAFAKLKELLRKLNASTIDQLWRAIGSVCSLFTPDQCWNFFRHCGYANAST